MAISKEILNKKKKSTNPEPLHDIPKTNIKHESAPVDFHHKPYPHIILYTTFAEAKAACDLIFLKPGETHTEFYKGNDDVYHCVVAIGNIHPNDGHLYLTDSGSLSSIDTQLSDMSDNISYSNKIIENLNIKLNKSFNDLSTNVNNLLNEFSNNLEAGLNNINTALTEFEDLKQDVSTQFNDLRNSVEVIINNFINNVSTNITDLNNKFDDLSTNINGYIVNVDEQLDNLDTTVDNLNSSITNIIDNVNDLSANVSELFTEVKAELNNLNSSFVNEVNRLDNLIDNVNNELLSLASHISNIDASLLDIQKQFSGYKPITDSSIYSLFHDDIYTVNLCCYTEGGHIEIYDYIAGVNRGGDSERVAECTPFNEYKTYVIGDDVTLNAVANEGYRLKKWIEDGDTLFSTNASINLVFNEERGDINVIGTLNNRYEPLPISNGYTAIFGKIFKLTYDVSLLNASIADYFGDSIKIVGCYENDEDNKICYVDEYENVFVTGVPREKHNFKYFTVDGSIYETNPYEIVNIRDDHHITAYFEEERYYFYAEADVTEHGDIGYTWTLDGNAYHAKDNNVIAGVDVTVRANPSIGYTFAEWVYGADGEHLSYNNPYTLEVNAMSPKHIIAVFNKLYTVNFIVDGDIIKSISVINNTVIDPNDIPANPEKYGYDFIGWDNEEFTIDLPITSNTDFIAIFEQKEITVNFYMDDAKTDLYYSITTYFNDDIYGPDENPTKSGHTFNGWTNEDGYEVGQTIEILPENNTIDFIANWQEEESNLYVFKTINILGDSAEYNNNNDLFESLNAYYSWCESAGYTHTSSDKIYGRNLSVNTAEVNSLSLASGSYAGYIKFKTTANVKLLLSSWRNIEEKGNCSIYLNESDEPTYSFNAEDGNLIKVLESDLFTDASEIRNELIVNNIIDLPKDTIVEISVIKNCQIHIVGIYVLE